MSAAFDGVAFGERGGGTTFPAWSNPGVVIVKKVPGGDINVLQVIGMTAPRLALVAKCTQAQLAALYGKVGATGTLVFGYETCTAYLESIDNVAEQSAGKNTYYATLNLIRGSSPGVSSVSNAILLEDSTYLLLEDGTNLLLE